MNEKIKVVLAHLKEQLPDAKESWITSKGSQVTLGWIHAADPLAVELLIAALKQSQQRVDDEICRANREHHRGFMMACKHLEEHANVHYADAAEVEIAALRKRIAELEAKSTTPALYLCKVSRGGEELYSECGKDYPRGRAYFTDTSPLAVKLPDVKKGEVLVTVAGLTGCGKSAIAGEIEIALRAIGLPVTWSNGDAEKRMTGADWLTALEMYKPTVRIVEQNVSGGRLYE